MYNKLYLIYHLKEEYSVNGIAFEKEYYIEEQSTMAVCKTMLLHTVEYKL